MELSLVLPTYGRDDAGQSATTAIHQPDETISATSAAASWRMRFQSFGLPATTYTRTKAGSTRNACSIFVLNAKPTSTPERTSMRVRPVSTADHSAHAAARQRNVRNASGLLYRNMSTATGVSANAIAARCAAASPAHLRTRRCRINTDATPASASGSSMLHALKPKTRPDSACTHRSEERRVGKEGR